jgi:hypothetical protein
MAGDIALAGNVAALQAMGSRCNKAIGDAIYLLNDKLPGWPDQRAL